MNLSMWIIDHWLAEYKPVCKIISGKRNIMGVRIFVDGETPDMNYLYLDIPANAASKHQIILLMNQNDTIIVKNVDFNVLFNKVMKAFEYYNQLEKLLGECLGRINAEQSVISACEHLLGPMFIISPAFDILAVSHNYKPEEVNRFWSDILAGKVSPELAYRIKNSDSLSMLGKEHRQFLYTAEYVAPYTYGIMNTYYDQNHNVLGQLIVGSDHEPTPFEQQITEWMMSYIQQIPYHKTGNQIQEQSIVPAESILEQICCKNNTEKNCVLLQEIMDWKNDMQFCFIILQPVEFLDSVYLNMERESLQKDRISFISFLHKKNIVLLEYGDLLPEADLKKIIVSRVHYSFAIGISLHFSDLREASFFMQQAQEAAGEAAKSSDSSNPFSLCSFDKIAIRQIIHETNIDYQYCCLHPAVREMLVYDRKYHTQYVATLRIYLKNERSHLKSSQELYVHRNTVLHRIEKIKELWNLDLEDADLRTYLYISLLYLASNHN